MKEKKQFTTAELIKQMMPRQPEDVKEDLWLIAVVTDDPEMPTYEERRFVKGSYDFCVHVAAQFVDEAMLAKRTGLRVESYCGEGVRNYLATYGAHEAQYQKDKNTPERN